MTDSEDSKVLDEKEKNEDKTDSSLTKSDENVHKSSENEKQEENQSTGVEKREKPEDESEDEDTKRKKTDKTAELSFLDIVQSLVKDNHDPNDKFNVLTNTKEYDCPIAKLAKIKPSDGFLGAVKSDNSSTDTDTVTEKTEETPEPENKQNEIFLEPSMSENEKLLQEIKKCKLSVYKNSEWTVPVPVVTHLILNKDSSNKRVVCFQFGTGRLLLNTVLLPSMSFNKLKNKSIIFIGQALGDSTRFIPHRLMFTDSNVRDEFHDLYSK